jgi:hypothetical protein
MTGDPWPERMDVDVGYRDPWDPRDELPAEPPDRISAWDIEPMDEAAIEAARDFCETCGRWRPDGGCPACGDDLA